MLMSIALQGGKIMTKQRMALVSLISILVFGLLLGGQLIYQNKWVNGNLTQESQQIQGVLSAEIITYDQRSEILVKTGHIKNLQSVSAQLQKISGTKPIRFVDQRTPELERIFQHMQFPLQEGIKIGNFTQMENNLRKIAGDAGVNIELAMDSEAIYLDLNKEESQLLAVVERHGQGIFLPSQGELIKP
jgi:hypothetical protein